MSAIIDTLEGEMSIDASELPEASASSTYKFDEEFQAKIAALSVRDTTFMQRTEGLVKPEYFENSAEGALVHVINRYFEKYKKVPGDKKVMTMLIKADMINKVLKPEMGAAAVRRMVELEKHDISDRDYVIDQVATFARHQAVSKAILDSVGHLDLNEFDKISTTLKKALDVGEYNEGQCYDYGAMIESRTKDRKDRAAGHGPVTGVTTGYPEIDKHLYHKGWGKRELSVLMGGAKAGKTTALIDFGISACTHIHKYNVLYVTLEVSEKIIGERLDSRLSEVAMFELDRHIDKVSELVTEIMSKAGRFDIREFPTGSMRVSDLRRLIEREKSRGKKYDLICVDYADLMAPERVTDNAMENSKNVYVALRGLAMQEDVAILTATQTNREGAKKMVATMTDVAEDFNKIRIADIVISINKTDEERKLQQCRLFFAAVRNGPSNFSIRIEQDNDRMRFVKAVLGEE